MDGGVRRTFPDRPDGETLESNGGRVRVARALQPYVIRRELVAVSPAA